MTIEQMNAMKNAGVRVEFTVSARVTARDIQCAMRIMENTEITDHQAEKIACRCRQAATDVHKYHGKGIIGWSVVKTIFDRIKKAEEQPVKPTKTVDGTRSCRQTIEVGEVCVAG